MPPSQAELFASRIAASFKKDDDLQHQTHQQRSSDNQNPNNQQHHQQHPASSSYVDPVFSDANIKSRLDALSPSSSFFSFNFSDYSGLFCIFLVAALIAFWLWRRRTDNYKQYFHGWQRDMIVEHGRQEAMVRGRRHREALQHLSAVQQDQFFRLTGGAPPPHAASMWAAGGAAASPIPSTVIQQQQEIEAGLSPANMRNGGACGGGAGGVSAFSPGWLVRRNSAASSSVSPHLDDHGANGGDVLMFGPSARLEPTSATRLPWYKRAFNFFIGDQTQQQHQLQMQLLQHQHQHQQQSILMRDEWPSSQPRSPTTNLFESENNTAGGNNSNNNFEDIRLNQNRQNVTRSLVRFNDGSSLPQMQHYFDQSAYNPHQQFFDQANHQNHLNFGNWHNQPFNNSQNGNNQNIHPHHQQSQQQHPGYVQRGAGIGGGGGGGPCRVNQQQQQQHQVPQNPFSASPGNFARRDMNGPLIGRAGGNNDMTVSPMSVARGRGGAGVGGPGGAGGPGGGGGGPGGGGGGGHALSSQNTNVPIRAANARSASETMGAAGARMSVRERLEMRKREAEERSALVN